MTTEQLVRRLKRLPEGEYFTNDDSLCLMVANKSEYNVDWLGEKTPKLMYFLDFNEAFNAAKYGLEYMTGGKIRYIGTNDLHTLVVKK